MNDFVVRESMRRKLAGHTRPYLEGSERANHLKKQSANISVVTAEISISKSSRKMG